MKRFARRPARGAEFAYDSLCRLMAWTIPRAREGLTFHGLFYGRIKFCCKTMQFCATRRQSEIANYLESATICKAVKICATR